MNEMIFPSSDVIEKVITDDTKKKYGTNFNQENINDRITGAKFILTWQAIKHINGKEYENINLY